MTDICNARLKPVDIFFYFCVSRAPHGGSGTFRGATDCGRDSRPAELLTASPVHLGGVSIFPLRPANLLDYKLLETAVRARNFIQNSLMTSQTRSRFNFADLILLVLPGKITGSNGCKAYKKECVMSITLLYVKSMIKIQTF